MPEEAEPQALVLVCASDDARDVCHCRGKSLESGPRSSLASLCHSQPWGQEAPLRETPSGPDLMFYNCPFKEHLKLKSFILSQVTQQAKRHQGPQPLGLQHALEYLGDRHSGSI